MKRLFANSAKRNRSQFGRTYWSRTVGILCVATTLLVVFSTNAALARNEGGKGSFIGLTIGSPAVPLPNGLSVCGEISAGWGLEANGTRIRPPTDYNAVGASITVTLGKTSAECAKSSDTQTFVAIGKLPQVDRRNIELDIDEGRAELFGTAIDGARLWWHSATESGQDTCVAPATVANQQQCSFATSRTLPADPSRFSLYLLPAGAPGPSVLYDINGKLIAPEGLAITPSKVVIDRVWPEDEVADLSSGEALIALPHGEAVAAVECDRGNCTLEAGTLSIRATRDTPQGATVRLQMRPRVFVRSGANLADRVSRDLDFAYCPVSATSLGPFRDLEAAHVILRLNERCAAIADSLSWTINGAPATVATTYPDGEELLVALAIGHIVSNRIQVVGHRGKNGADVVAVATLRTIAAPHVQSKITLDGFGEIGFIPTNRSARIAATAPKFNGRLVPLAVDGIYSITSDAGGYRIKGLDDADGFVTLRYAIRDASLPGDLSSLDLAMLEGPVQRELRPVNVAAPVALPVANRAPFVELLCNDSNGRPKPILPGTTPHLPFASRDSCHLVIHRARILPEDGEQRLDLRVDVRSASGAVRSEGELSQRLVVRHGSDPIVYWLGGVESQFDKLTVRVTHVVDEMQYLRNDRERLEVPAATYSVVFENTRLRFYATAAIPASLFRFSNEPNAVGNGALTLNLGVLSRLTWVNREGSDGLFGLEAGIMGMGLSSQNTRQLNLVAGIGMAVPLGNTRQISQAAINLHAWIAYRPGPDSTLTYDVDGKQSGVVALSNWSFVFGPSVTFGNVGLDL